MSDNIIIHGFPAAGLEHIYRNPRSEVLRFLDTRHKNRYMVYNFCCEPGRGYDPQVFHGNVHRYPFKDHCTPPLETMCAFANDAKLHLEQREDNVISMHCKAGKGRAGLMCCVAMIRTGFKSSAIEAMDYYDEKRVSNQRGLTVQSQRKFVIFYEMLWRHHWGVTGNIGDVPAEKPGENKFPVPEQPEIQIIGVQVIGLWATLLKNLQIKIFQGTNFSPVLLVKKGTPHSNEPNRWTCNCEVKGNFKIYLYQANFMKKKKVVELWHNTLFLDINNETNTVDFGLDQLDVKRKKKKRLGEDFGIRIFLSDGKYTDITKEQPESTEDDVDTSPLQKEENDDGANGGMIEMSETRLQEYSGVSREETTAAL